MVLTLHLRFVYGSQNKQRLLSYTILIDGFVYPRWGVFTAWYALSSDMKHTFPVF